MRKMLSMLLAAVLLPPAVRYAVRGYDWLEQAMLKLADGETVGSHSRSILPGR